MANGNDVGELASTANCHTCLLPGFHCLPCAPASQTRLHGGTPTSDKQHVELPPLAPCPLGESDIGGVLSMSLVGSWGCPKQPCLTCSCRGMAQRQTFAVPFRGVQLSMRLEARLSGDICMLLA
jgi:hypothetical protein